MAVLLKGLSLLLLVVLAVELEALRIAAPSSKPGKCPRSRSLYRSRVSTGFYGTCTSDYQCHDDQKCCGHPKRCRDPVSSHPPTGGSCPPPTFPPGFCERAFVVNQCDSSTECKAGEHCCPALCNARDCVKVGFTPSRNCPIAPTNPLPDFCAARSSIPGCSSNEDCRRGLCCPDECGVLMCGRTRYSLY